MMSRCGTKTGGRDESEDSEAVQKKRRKAHMSSLDGTVRGESLLTTCGTDCDSEL